MAFTERYVSVAGSGAHDGSSPANEWTLAEAIAADAAGLRKNVKPGSYSQGAATLVTGTVSAMSVWRGYLSSPGDLDNQGRSSTGPLNVTNFPVITLTGVLIPGPFCALQNLDFTGALSSALIGDNANDNWIAQRIRVTNTQNNASARCLVGDNNIQLFGCDFYCSGAAHASVVDVDQDAVIRDCRLRGTSTSALLTLDRGTIDRSTFYGNASSVGIVFQSAANHLESVRASTFYGLGTAVTFPNLTPIGIPSLIDNHVTDCSKWIDNLHSATVAISVLETYNRLRDVTTPRTGVETVTTNEVTTDTGGAETDYVDAGNGNFYLISGAPGRAAGSPANVDIGAYQHADAGVINPFTSIYGKVG